MSMPEIRVELDVGGGQKANKSSYGWGSKSCRLSGSLRHVARRLNQVGWFKVFQVEVDTGVGHQTAEDHGIHYGKS